MSDPESSPKTKKGDKGLWNGLRKSSPKKAVNRMFHKKPSSSSLRTLLENSKISTAQEDESPISDDEPSPLLRPRSMSAAPLAASSNCINNQQIRYVPKARRKPQYGIDPVSLLERNPTEEVPSIIVTCASILREKIRTEGMFRVPGRMTDILEMKISFEQGQGLGQDDPDVHAVAGLFCQFFRELPAPLLLYGLYQKWIEAAKLPEDQVPDRLQKICEELPEANYNILKFIMELLRDVSKHSGANRMGPRNLALVFGASLLNPPEIEQYDLENIKLQCTVVEVMIDLYEYIFESNTENRSFTRSKNKAMPTIPAGRPGISSSSGLPATTLRQKQKTVSGKSKKRNSVRQHHPSKSLDGTQSIEFSPTTDKPKKKTIDLEDSSEES